MSAPCDDESKLTYNDPALRLLGPAAAAAAIDSSLPASTTTAFRSRFTSKVTKIFSSPKPAKPATASTSILVADTDASQDGLRAKPPSHAGPSSFLGGKSRLEGSAERSISRSIFELWDEAYDELSKKEKTLVADYEALLSTSLGGAIESSATTFSSSAKIQRRQSMSTLLEKKIEEIERGEWKLRFKDHELAVKDLVEPVVGVMYWAKDFIGTALKPSPYGSIAWAGVCLLLSLVLNPTEQEAVRVKSLDNVAAIISRSSLREELYHKRYGSVDGDESKREFAASHLGYRDALRSLYIKILNFQATNICFLSKRKISRLTADTVKWTDWENMLAEIKEQEDVLKSVEEQWRDMKYDEECSLLNNRHRERMQGSRAIEAEVSRVHSVIMQAQHNKERKELLTWLSSVDPSQNYNSARASHAPLTGSWLLESNDFKRWEETPNSLLWLHGKAGAGKTILSSSVIHHLEKAHHLDPCTALVYFYFSFNDTEKQTTENMLRSIVVQLCGGRPDTPKSLLDLASYRDRGLQPGLEQLEESLKGSTRDFKRVYLVLDALDECPLTNGERERLLKALQRIHGWALTNLHMLCTSRPEPVIKAELAPLFRDPATSTIDLQRRSVNMNKDIVTYIDQRIASSSFNSWPPEIKGEVKNILTEKANGMFQYVSFQLSALQKAKGLAAVKKALEDLPEGLDEIYNRALSSIDPCEQEQAIRCLTWLAYSVRPLFLGEVAEAAIIDPKSSLPFEEGRRYFNPMDVLDILPGLVTVSRRSSGLAYSMSGLDEANDLDVGTNTHEVDDPIKTSPANQKRYMIRLAHFSIKEYLVSDRIQKSRCSAYSINEILANVSIAEACLVYLFQFDKSDSLTLQTLELPLVGYVAEHWISHARWAGEDAIHLRSLIREFFLVKKFVYINWVRLFDIDIPSNGPYLTKEIETIPSPLYYATLAGMKESVTQLLAAGADVNAQCGEFGTVLQAASFIGPDEIVQQLLSAGADVNIQGGKYGTVLQAASYNGSDQVVQWLLEAGADVNIEHGIYNTALQAASYKGAGDIVQRLLNAGANVNTRGGYFSNALQAASGRGYYQIVQWLIEAGADLNAKDRKSSNALQAASYAGFDNCVQLLLSAGADVNIRGGKYDTALQGASYRGLDHIVQLLLEAGADVNTQGGKFGTALQAAAFRGFDQVVQQLLEAGADVNARSGEFGTALQAAAYRGFDQVVQRLLEAGADVNAQSSKFDTALQAASYRGQDHTIQLLLEAGADVNAQGGQYNTALQAASYRGCDQVVQQLLDAGADINAQGGMFGTALQAASYIGYDRIVQRLLNARADVHVHGGRFGNALQAALTGGFGTIIQQLLEAGADVNV